MPPTISGRTLRRYALGRTGLWPGRRWAGRLGVSAALREARAVQIDPLNVVARSHDLALHGRVAGYRPELLTDLMYRDREFFDYGGVVFVHPMDELPHWRPHMSRRRDSKKWAGFADANAAILDNVRAELRARGPLRNRDFTGPSGRSTFRSAKLSAHALYYLWLTGELMTHSRRGFERLYHFTDQVAPAAYRHSSPEPVADAYMAAKALDFLGIAPEPAWRAWFSHFAGRPVDRAEGKIRLTDLVEAGLAAPVTIGTSKVVQYTSAAGLAALDAIEAGTVPPGWAPLETDTDAEVTFLAPLEVVSARGRAQKLFGFEYVWEVYKPAAARRWGYYTMPVLYGDSLVARIDPRLDRDRGTLVLNGIYLAEPALEGSDTFARAMARGLSRMAGLVDARGIALTVSDPPALGRAVTAHLEAEATP